jgi:hypothetical protein
MDSPKDEPRLGKQKEDFPQQEIDISTASYQVSIKPIPDASISIDTQPLDKQQPEARHS